MNPANKKSDKISKLAFPVKIGVSLLIILLWAMDSDFFFRPSNTLLAIAVVLTVLSTTTFGIMASAINRKNSFLFYFVIVDLFIIDVFVYPVYLTHALNLVLIFLLLAASTLINNRTQKIYLFSFHLLAVIFISVWIGVKESAGYAAAEGFWFGGFSLLVFWGVIKLEDTLLHYRIKIAQLEEDKRSLLQKHQQLNKEVRLTGKRLEFLNKDLRRKSFEIQNILSLTDQLGSNPDSRKIISSFLLTMAGQIGCMHAVYFGRNESQKNFYSILDQKGIHDPAAEKFRIYADSFLIQILSGSREPLMVSKIPTYQLYRDEKELLSYFSDDLISPIVIRNKVIGMFLIGPKISGNAFTREDLNLISILTNQAAFILEQSNLNEEIFDFYNKTVRTLLRAQEVKDSFSKGHIIRTTQYVQALGKKIGISNEEQKNLIYGTILHDVGKIALNEDLLKYDKIIEKPDSKIKNKILDHTLIGASILKSVGFDNALVDLALHHHEWFNGQGYPHNLKGNQINLQTRILAVCNAYDAMTSDKPYRKSLQLEWAVDQLKKRSGKQFDPDIVDAFVQEIQVNPKFQKLNS